jgi:hypothetical protein
MDFPRRTPRLIAVFLAASIFAAGPARADAEDEPAAPTISVPTAELGFFGGFGAGAEAAGSLFDHRLRLDGSVRGLWGGVLGEGAAMVRLVGSPANALWLRGGYMFQGFNYSCSIVDRATAGDVGVAYRKRWAGGSLFAAEGGVEYLTRPTGLYCNDSLLSGGGAGLRVSVGGQYALTRGIGIYGRVGMRTGPHVMEIGVLPEAWLGIAFEM